MLLIPLTLDCFDDLVGHVPDLVYWKGLEVVLFEEVKRAQSKQFKRNAHMAVVVKPVEHTHTTAVPEEKQSKNFLLMISIFLYYNHCRHRIWLETRVLLMCTVSYSELICRRQLKAFLHYLCQETASKCVVLCLKTN